MGGKAQSYGLCHSREVLGLKPHCCGYEVDGCCPGGTMGGKDQCYGLCHCREEFDSGNALFLK